MKTGPLPELLLSQEAKAVTGSSTSLSLPYGLPVAFDLLPCASTGNNHPYYNLYNTIHRSCNIKAFVGDAH